MTLSGKVIHVLRIIALAGLLALPGCDKPRSDIAVVDVDAVFKDYKKSKVIHEGLAKDKADMESKGQVMLDEINKLVKESEILSDEARKERENRIREKGAALEVYRRGATQNLLDQTNEVYQKLTADLRAAAETVARKRGVRIVFDSSMVVQSGKDLDITPEVTAELNRIFDEESRKGKK
ncbi:MAG: OmpH family outer membrane protein [Candidatus Aureabacteria bacterium]|nr:OmpH family outer membrane protein [Candidatus Auribacterota bacterium]